MIVHGRGTPEVCKTPAPKDTKTWSYIYMTKTTHLLTYKVPKTGKNCIQPKQKCQGPAALVKENHEKPHTDLKII